MKRYLVFCCPKYYPLGGWDDFQGSADTVRDAEEIRDQYQDDIGCGWSWHFVDTEESPPRAVREGFVEEAV